MFLEEKIRTSRRGLQNLVVLCLCDKVNEVLRHGRGWTGRESTLVLFTVNEVGHYRGD